MTTQLSRTSPSPRVGTKAETLEWLATRVRNARVLPQIRIDLATWRSSPDKFVEMARAQNWLDTPLIVRSSALDEDASGASQAGRYLSVLDVRGADALLAAAERVAQSFDTTAPGNQIFAQPFLAGVAVSGVAFTRDPNSGGHYVVVNYDDSSGRTDSVTAGVSNQTKTFYYFRDAKVILPGWQRKVIQLGEELTSLLGEQPLDLEFAVTTAGDLYLLQVRPLKLSSAASVGEAEQRKALEEVSLKIRERNRRHPYLHGGKTVFGIMPDWNPAEIIGVRPRPLALSLYREIVTDNVWAYQRDGYGYKNLRSFPLLVSFAGLPYIDVRVSFNSFIPADVDASLSEKLANHYMRRLIESPSHHDKVEFQIVYSCYTLDLHERMQELTRAGFTDDECQRLETHLRNLTNRIINRETGLWQKDLSRIEELEPRRKKILSSDMDVPSKIYWLLEDCKRYGTLPFAGLARAGFIAVQMLKSMVAVEILTPREYEAFMRTLSTVSSQLSQDFAQCPPAEFLARYGHLRPGTYDILCPRYDEDPSRYFDFSSRPRGPEHAADPFTLSLPQLKKIEKMLREHALQYDVLGLFDFLKAAIEGREYSKFVFTKSLSDTLSLIKTLAAENGFTVDDCSYLDIKDLMQGYAATGDIRERLAESIRRGKETYAVTRQILLPPLISDETQVWAFEMPSSDPNYITLGTARGPVKFADAPKESLRGSVLLLPSADPGYDWIFSHGIAGFITAYGGVNSHMAIRATELGIPAVIGAGQRLFDEWKTGAELELDCVNRQVRIVR